MDSLPDGTDRVPQLTEVLRAAVSPRTTAILLNSPHNPNGTVLRRAELEAIAAVAQEHDLVVISDEGPVAQPTGSAHFGGRCTCVMRV